MAFRNLIIARTSRIENGCGLLGAQSAATAIGRYANCESRVLAFEPSTSPSPLLDAMGTHYPPQETAIGISGLCYYDTHFFSLVEGLKARGYLVYLGGPEARANFLGEPGAGSRPHRFGGWRDLFRFAVHGDASRIFPLLDILVEKGIRGFELPSPPPPGIVTADRRADDIPGDAPLHVISDMAPITAVDWGNLLKAVDAGGAVPFGQPLLAQVLGHCGCPHAGKRRMYSASIPFWMGYGQETLTLPARGCSFSALQPTGDRKREWRPAKCSGKSSTCPNRTGARSFSN